MIVHFDNLAEHGIIRDVEAHELPQSAWSDGQNVRFRDRAVEKFDGDEAVYGTAAGSPYFAMQVIASPSRFWHYASLTDIHATDGTNHTTITPATMTGTLNASIDINWTGGSLGGGVFVLNNGVDEPFQWAGTGVNSPYDPLGNWPTGMVAKVLRPFKQFLIAADLDEGAGRNHNLLRWSHPAIPGGVPASWDYTDRTKDAGRVQISQTPDAIIDLVPMRDLMIIYKENSVWSMQFVGGNAKFSFRNVFADFGCLSRRCVQSFYGKHVVLTNDDLLVHDGSQARSVIDGRFRNWLVNNIDGDNYQRSFLALNHRDTEVWACIPQTGYDLPNIALVWNWSSNTVTLRTLQGTTPHIAWGVIDAVSDLTYDGEVGVFDDASGAFDEQVDSGALRQMLICGHTNNAFYRANTTNTLHGTAMTSFVEREAVPIGRQNQATGEIRPNLTAYKYITELWPVIEGTEGGLIDVYVGTRAHVGDSVSWQGPYPFTIGITRKIDVRIAGPVIDVKFQSTDDVDFKLLSYGLEVRLGGAR